MRDADLVIIIKGEHAGRRGVVAESRSPHFNGEKDAVWIGSPPTIVGLADDAMILDTENWATVSVLEESAAAQSAPPEPGRLSPAKRTPRVKALTLTVGFS
jgi:hypothetical protein